MYSRFELTVPGPGPVSRDLILTLSNLLRRLAVSERGKRDDIDIGFGVTLFCDPDTLRFSSETELSAHIPPLAQINGFHLSVMFNPWHMHEDEPSLSLHIHKPDESASFTITVEAVTQARAQELALNIQSGILDLTFSSSDCSDKPTDSQNTKHGCNSDQCHDGKFLVARKVLTFIFTAIGVVSGIITIALAWPDILKFMKFIFRLFHMQP